MVFADLFVAGNFDNILFSVIIAVGVLIVGIFLGGFVSYLIKRVVKGTDIEKDIRPSFVRLIVAVIRWSIYIVFLDVAIRQLPFPSIEEFLGEILLVIPAFIGALILIGIGFAIAIYLRDIVEDSEVSEWKDLSQYLYYFVLYVFGVYAVNLALIAVDAFIRNILIVALTVIVGGAVAFNVIKKR
jgi:hypothetical protein